MQNVKLQGKIKNMFNKIRVFILDLFFPLRCVGCGKLDFCMCPQCFSKIILIKASFCPFCQTLTPNGSYCKRCYGRIKPKLNGLIVAAYFKEGPLKEAIHQFKYQFVKDLSEPLGNLLTKALNDKNFGQFAIVPVPLSSKRLRWRGFNQAELLSKVVAKNLGLSLKTNILKRIKNTKPQIELSKKERKENIIGAFKAISEVPKKVLLVDDVYTTGATLNECAKILKEAGAKQVWGLVVAKD